MIHDGIMDLSRATPMWLDFQFSALGIASHTNRDASVPPSAAAHVHFVLPPSVVDTRFPCFPIA